MLGTCCVEVDDTSSPDIRRICEKVNQLTNDLTGAIGMTVPKCLLNNCPDKVYSAITETTLFISQFLFLNSV